MADPPWHWDFTHSISSYYDGQPDEGRACCERLLNWRGLPPYELATTRRNAVHYAPRLDQSIPGCLIVRQDLDLAGEWTVSGCTFAANSGGAALILACEAPTAASLAIADLDPAHAIATGARRLVDHTGGAASAPRRFLAPRAWMLHGQPAVLSRRAPLHDADPDSPPLALASIDPAAGTVNPLPPIDDPVLGPLPAPLADPDRIALLSALEPATILEVSRRGGPPGLRAWWPAPHLLSHCLPATTFIPDGDGWLGLACFTADWLEGHQTWLHRLIRLSPELAIAGISHPFLFRDGNGQRAGGLLRDGDRLLVAFAEDGAAHIASLPAAEVTAMLRPAWASEHRLHPEELDRERAGRLWGRAAFTDNGAGAWPPTGWADTAESVVNRAAPFLASVREAPDLTASLARMTAFLLLTQHRSGVTGDSLEIGVDAGWYSLVLATALFPGERHIAVDLWDWQDQNVDRSGFGRRAEFEERLRTWAPDVGSLVLQANSLDLGDDFVAAYHGLRFVSVDGGHTRLATCNDLHLAERLLRPGGIAALDDIYRDTWSGVTAGIARYYRQDGSLVPIALAGNKVFLTTSADWAMHYRAALAAFFPERIDPFRPTQEFFEFDGALVLHPAGQSDSGAADLIRLRSWIAATADAR